MARLQDLNIVEIATAVRSAVASAIEDGYGELDTYIPGVGDGRDYDWDTYEWVSNDPTLIDITGEVEGEYDDDTEERTDEEPTRLRVKIVELEVAGELWDFTSLSGDGPKSNVDKRAEIAQAMNDLADSLTDDMTIDQAYKKINALAKQVRTWE